MNTFLSTSRFKQLGTLALMMFGLTVAGCGGGGSDGGSGGAGFETANFNENEAVINDEDDAKTASVAARESAQQAILEEEQPEQSLPMGMTIAGNGTEAPVYEISLALIETASAPSAAKTTVPGDCGGQAVINYNENSGAYRIDYQDYCLDYVDDDRYIIDGFYEWDDLDNYDNYEMRFSYTVTYRGETYRSQGTYKCVDGSCSYQNYFVGTDGRQYRTENVSVYGSNGSYSVSAKVYDQDLGYVEYTSSGLTLCESGTGFSSGTITVTASGSTLTITFSGCSSYTVMYDGVGYTIDY